MNYEQLLEEICKGVPFKIDINTLSLKVGNKLFIDKGKPINEYDIGSMDDDFLTKLDEYYSVYKHSVPTTNDSSKPIFKALKYDDLTDEDRDFGIDRNIAKFELEYYFLKILILNKLNYYFTTTEKWFYQSTRDKDLIILRSWIKFD